MSDLNNVKIIINENENNIINDNDNQNGNNDEVDNCKYENKEQLNSSNNNENNCNNYNENDEKCDIKSENTEKNNCKTYNKKNKNNKTISVLVRQSDEIQKTYKPSIFEDVINGPRGPDVRLHRHSVVIGLLKLLLILYFTAGIILLSVVSLCITINVGYVCVQIDDTNSLIQMIFFVFYFNALYSIIYSCWKTYLRLIKTIINSNFGSSINDLFIKRILGYYVTIKIVNITMPKQYKDHPKDWYEKLNLIVFCIFMFIILLPFPIVAFIFGYWEITGIICILFVGGGALSIIGLNAFSRLILFIKLFSRLDEFYYNAPFYVDLDERAENQTSYLRLVYCTSNGLYGGCNLFDYILKLLIIMCAQISVSAFFFGSFDPSVIKVGISFGLLIIMLPILFRKKICTIFQKLSVKLHLLSENKIKVNKTKDNDKINAKMEATHNQYLNNKRNTIIMNNNRKSMNLSGTYLDFNNLNLNEGSGSLRCKTIKKESKNNFNFYNLLNSKNPYFHHKVLLTWNIGILTSWKGCLTIFILRLIKFIVGISFMAVLNYFRYSESSDSDETKQSLYIDIISHMIFVIILLLQDVVFLIPASTEIISMKTRRYFLSILLVVELILITVMRVAIINNYIPMAFILIAYANFIVHPDPRYSWDDEETERKTLFDIFNPEEMQYKRNTRACHNSAIILMVLSLVLILSFIVSIKFSDKGKKSSYTIEDLTDDEGELTKQKPAICQWRADGISINEFCALSYAAYYRNVEDATHSWEFGRPKSSINNFIVDNNNLNSTTGVHYIDFINKESNVLVVAIRGTLTMEDMFQDCYIWSASALLQVSGYFGTFINFWPRETIASLVNFIVKQFTNLRLLYWIDVEKHIKELQMNTNYTLYLTGHSLGGGVAGVIASHLNIPAITFSSPGLGYSYKTYDIQLKKLIKNFVNIIPMSDPIPKLDSQVGEIQYIECKTGHPFACHRIMNTLDTLNNLCSENSVYRYWDNQVEKVIDGVPVNYELHP
ncbi:hypothetical protein H8356DRAFT_1022645 [Neocallimastix lanati (nom. inval.)]|nr:hypothetical protein H8356DRAFT_1022645 [Neocallimastix sp. JGI-2020a]